MKIHPPIPDIPADAPYKNDLFKRQEFGDSLFSLFKSIQESMVVCVDAPWGDGKTTFANMWLADLNNRGVKCIYFDAYAHDYADEPFVAFCGEILSLAEKEFADDKTIQAIKKDFFAKAKRITTRIISVGTRIGLKALSFGNADNDDLKDLSRVKGDYTGGTPAGLSSIMEAMLDDYAESKKNRDEFRSQLSALGSAVRAKQGFPLLIVVDELDRCRPNFALSLIERIKHIFAARDVSFMLLANTAQLQNYAKALYGEDIDAANYLRKFFTLTVELPKDSRDQNQNDYWKYTKRLIEHFEIVEVDRDMSALLAGLFRLFKFSLREMEACLSNIAAYYAQLPPNHLSCSLVISVLAVLRMKSPGIYSRLALNKISYEELIQLTGIDRVHASDYLKYSQKWLTDRLKYLLFTEEQLNAPEIDQEILHHAKWVGHGLGLSSKNEIIPMFCAELSRFKIEANENNEA